MANSDEELDSNSADLDDAPSYATRPNRFNGTDAAWDDFIRAELDLTDELLQERAQDLAIHLYNAHHASTAGRQELSTKHGDRAHGSTDPEDSVFPPRDWTAWPMSPTSVPRSDHQDHPSDGLEAFTIQRPRDVLPSTELEEILTSIVLRIAREKINSREWEGSDDASQSNNIRSRISKSSRRRHGHDRGSEVQDFDMDVHQEDPVASGTLSDHSNASATDRSKRKRSRQSSIASKSSYGEDAASDVDMEEQDTSEYLVPVLTRDDDAAAKLLRPTVRSVMSKLDEVLLELQATVEVAMDLTSDSDVGTNDEYTSDGGFEREPIEERNPSEDLVMPSDDEATPAKAASTRVKRGRGRPRMVLDIPPDDINPKSSEENQILPDNEAAPKKRGRPRKPQEPREGESHNEMLVRLAKKNKQALPFATRPPKDSSAPQPSNHSSRSNQRHKRQRRSASQASSGAGTSRSRSRTSTRRRASRTRDRRTPDFPNLVSWPEVLRTAASIGLPANVIARASKRCADLFGTSVDLHVEQEDIRAEEGFLQEIPPFDSDSDAEVEDVEMRPKVGRRARRGVAVEDRDADRELETRDEDGDEDADVSGGEGEGVEEGESGSEDVEGSGDGKTEDDEVNPDDGEFTDHNSSRSRSRSMRR